MRGFNVQVRLMDFDNFYLNGSNLHTTVEVPPAVLRFGGEWDVPVTEDRTLRVTIPPRMKVRGKLRLAGYGVLRDERRRGDMLVEVRRWQPTTFRQALGSWNQYLVLGLRHVFAPAVAWWSRPATT